ncbi:MAG: heparinase II/III family protein [Cyclobacteriaceae bacterium]|nr:heparinase II/III family protein [Cyclobacteriaceae bacterium HetDA_MAG_MS6]
MKINNRLIISLIVVGFTMGCTDKKSDDPSTLAHPRIILNTKHKDQIVKRIEENQLVARHHQFCLAVADSMLDIPLIAYKKIGYRLLGTSRTYLKRMNFLGYAYQLTDNPKYAKRAEQEMLVAAGFDSWNPDHFLDVAEMTMALAIGYDWCYQDLTDSGRQLILEAILRKGLLPSITNDPPWWMNTDNNWGQVCHSGLAFGAWAIYEDHPDTAEFIIRRSMEKIKRSESSYEPDGVYPEGPMYWDYGTSFHVLFLDAYKSIYGDLEPLDVSEAFMNTGQFFLHVQSPTTVFNWGDATARQYFSSAPFWFAHQREDISLAYKQVMMLKDYLDYPSFGTEGRNGRLFPFSLIWLSRLDQVSERKPNIISWQGKGSVPVAFHRSSWDKDGLYLAIKGGSASMSHAHMDAGQFVIDALGIRWAYDLGSHNYNKLEQEGLKIWGRHQASERWQVLRYNNLSHNTLTVNERLHQADGKSELIEEESSVHQQSTVMDMTAAFAGQLERVIRQVSLIGDQFFIVKDKFQNRDSAASAVRWAFLTYDDITINGRSAMIHHEGKKMAVEVRYPENANLRTFSAQPQILPFEESNPGLTMLGFEVLLAPEQMDSLEVHFTPQRKEVTMR